MEAALVDQAALSAARHEALTAAEILTVEARIAWANNHGGEGCPEHRIPDQETLVEWVREGFMYPGFLDVVKESDQLLQRCCGLGGEFPEKRHDIAFWGSFYPPGKPPDLTAFIPTHGEHPGDGRVLTVSQLHRRWLELPGQGKHPLAPLIEAWQEHAPVQVTPETRKDKRLLAVLPPTPERKRGMLFGGLTNERRDPQLPLFPDLAQPIRKSVAILDLADASGVPVMSKGRGAPLPLRLFIRAGLSVKPQDRRHSSCRFAVTVEELKDGLFPNGWRARRDWPRIKQALNEASDYTFTDAGGGRCKMLALWRLPFDKNGHGLPDLKDHVVLEIAFPEGMTTGPEVDLPALGKLSVESGARFRAYIAAMSLDWKPGLTRRPVPGSSERYGWSRKLADYPVLTRADRRRLAFGEKDQGNRTRKQVDAPWRDLPEMVVISEDAVDLKTGERGWRIVPAEAAESFRLRRPNRSG